MSENEPLEDKVWRCIDADGDDRVFSFEDVKSAVQGLLAELKLECKPYDFLEVGNKKLSFEQIKQIIGKWFPDVFKEVKEDGLD